LPFPSNNLSVLWLCGTGKRPYLQGLCRMAGKLTIMLN